MISARNAINQALAIFFFFPQIKILYWTQVAHDARPDFRHAAALWTIKMFACQITMILTNAKGWSDGNIGNLVIGEYVLDQTLTYFDIADGYKC